MPRPFLARAEQPALSMIGFLNCRKLGRDEDVSLRHQ